MSSLAALSVGRPHSVSHHVDDRVLAEIRAKLTAARQAAQRPTVSYRAGQAPYWAQTEQRHDDDEQQPDRDSRAAVDEAVGAAQVEESGLSATTAAAGRASRAVRRAEVVEDVGSRRAEAAGSSSVQPPLPRLLSLLAVPEPEEESDDEYDRHIRQRQSRSAGHSSNQTDADRQQRQPDSTDSHRRAGTQQGANERERREEEKSAELSTEEAEGEEEDDDDSSFGSLGSSPPPARLLFKPVFKPRSARLTLDERDGSQDEDELDGQQPDDEQQQRERRRQHSRQQLKREMDRAAQRAEQRQRASEHGVKQNELADMPDDSDGDEEERDRERDAWKLRELHRLRRDRAALQQWRLVQGEEAEDEAAESKQGQQQQQQLGSLSRSVRAAPAVEAQSGRSEVAEGPGRSSMRFLQRYYHVGAFFADSREADSSFKRDFTAATGEDRSVDKSLLPAVMQVKHFGLKGRTKYTHLSDQDTSRQQPQQQQHDNIRRAAEVGVRGYTGKGATR